MTKEIIKISDIQLELKKELITNEQNIANFLEKIQNLKKQVFDFSTKEGIKEAKELKTQANKFVEELKKFCEPLEAEGKKISDVRSKITTTLKTGKNNVIDEILAPIAEREEKLKVIKNKLFIPSLSAESNAEKIAELEALDSYEWLALKDDALDLIERQKTFLAGEKIKFDEEKRLKAEAEEKARVEKENQIRLEAEAKAKEIAEREAQKAIDEANARAKQAEIEANAKIERARLEAERLEKEKQNAINAEKRKAELEIELKKQAEAKERQEAERLAKDKEHQEKIHNEILEDIYCLLNHVDGGVAREVAKNLIQDISKGEVRNLKIIY